MTDTKFRLTTDPKKNAIKDLKSAARAFYHFQCDGGENLDNPAVAETQVNKRLEVSICKAFNANLSRDDINTYFVEARNEFEEKNPSVDKSAIALPIFKIT